MWCVLNIVLGGCAIDDREFVDEPPSFQPAALGFAPATPPGSGLVAPLSNQAATMTGCATGTCLDCDGIPGGSARRDACGSCDTNPDNDCVQDCGGVWGGDATLDACGVCDSNPDNDCVLDCLGVPNGKARADNCGTCDSDPSNDCEQDCRGVWGGSARADNCGVCDDNPGNDCPRDCSGVDGGAARLDNCGVCDANPSNDCVRDCNGVWGGGGVADRCGTCDGDRTNDCVQDCAGVFGGSASFDACRVCDDNAGNDCVIDCNGVPGGPARSDACGVCDTNPNNDCFDGISGSMLLPQAMPFDLGSGPLNWSIAAGQEAYFYGNVSATPATFARITSTSNCVDGIPTSGYLGFSSLADITDASALTYTNGDPIGFGTRNADCFAGLLVFEQNGQYGVLDFENIEFGAGGAPFLRLQYWIGNPGETDFSRAR